MKLFVNDGVCFKRFWGRIVESEELGNGRIKLKIPNYLEIGNEYVNFIIPASMEDLEQDFLTSNISLNQIDKNTYNFKPTCPRTDNGIYALIRSIAIIPDDLYIPTTLRDKIKVLRRIKVLDFEADMGHFLSNVYLVKIQLQTNETLPLYLTCTTPFALSEHYVFYNINRECDVTEKKDTYIILNHRNKNDFISLSDLFQLGSNV